ncbi:hypothetical protein GQ54DRAFT_127167 [Martensiomyces pterosporus]|nr:hypothetical protein GQ54DRAFT_127167 [Martensiomyces pterosporus]
MRKGRDGLLLCLICVGATVAFKGGMTRVVLFGGGKGVFCVGGEQGNEKSRKQSVGRRGSWRRERARYVTSECKKLKQVLSRNSQGEDRRIKKFCPQSQVRYVPRTGLKQDVGCVCAVRPNEGNVFACSRYLKVKSVEYTWQKKREAWCGLYTLCFSGRAWLSWHESEGALHTYVMVRCKRQVATE